ncbi:hypothetical protein SH2C18_51880 [Clostridium sediminicola]|uniref:hypothetical protein n=1 Tax=Clostridium sediminicola TaxID=3114879 RepID=UPI0031F240FE
MEKYKIYFMLFSAIYLIAFGVFMKKSSSSKLSKVIANYTFIFGLFSFISGIISYINNGIGYILYNIFIIILLVTFIIILFTNLIVKKDRR